MSTRVTLPLLSLAYCCCRSGGSTKLLKNGDDDDHDEEDAEDRFGGMEVSFLPAAAGERAFLPTVTQADRQADRQYTLRRYQAVGPMIPRGGLDFNSCNHRNDRIQSLLALAPAFVDFNVSIPMDEQ